MPEISNFIRESAIVQKNEPIARGVYLMRLRAPRVATTCRPAQFLQILTDPGLSPFLRRPFSVLRVDRNAGWLDIIYDVIGPGTARLSAIHSGDQLDISGPLGRPFDPPDSKRILLVAGGVGLVPLAFLAWEHPNRHPDLIYLMGAANAARLPDMPALLPAGLPLHIATDDGSVGHRGFVTDLIAEYAIPNQTTILTCGPHPMMARVADIAAEQGKDVFDVFMDLSLEEDLDTQFITPLANGDEEAVSQIINYPPSLVSLSDGGAHVQFICDTAYPSYLLGHWVRDNRAMSLEKAIKVLAAHPAATLGLKDRGMIRPGMAADLTIFDPDTIRPLEPYKVSDLPGNGPRLIQECEGMHYTVVNGQVLVKDGKHTGSYPGRVLRGVEGM